MKVLFATKNPAKVKKYVDIIKKNGIELITANDVDIDINVDENGKNAIENAYIKAKTYYDATGIVSIGMDNNLFIEGIPEEKQPGVFVRRVNGKELNDDEMIEHYTNLVKEYGGKLRAKWVYGMVIYDGKTSKEYCWDKGGFYLIDKPSQKINVGYPLDSISINESNGKYFVDLTKEEKMENNSNNDEEDETNFILNSLKLG